MAGDENPHQTTPVGHAGGQAGRAGHRRFVATWRPNCYRDRPDDEQAEWMRRLAGEPHFLGRELAALVFHRVSPFHGKLPPPPERPAGAGRGWLTAHARRVRGLD